MRCTGHPQADFSRSVEEGNTRRERRVLPSQHPCHAGPKQHLVRPVPPSLPLRRSVSLPRIIGCITVGLYCTYLPLLSSPFPSPLPLLDLPRNAASDDLIFYVKSGELGPVTFESSDVYLSLPL
jgi:hypothetical protein